MNLTIGDYATRKSYDHDTVFKILNIKDGIFYLKGVDVRLFADALALDLVKVELKPETENYLEKVKEKMVDTRNDYFFLPGKILHIDGDNDYLTRCLSFYKESGVLAIGKRIPEEQVPQDIKGLLQEYKPSILIITGHDAYYKKKGQKEDIKNYKNSINFVKSINEARSFESNQDKLIIIAGACQSDYEELIKAGANFASSPKRVNIHALDPAIIAVSIALTERNKEIDLINILEKTKYGYEGMGGIQTNGVMYVGFPR